MMRQKPQAPLLIIIDKKRQLKKIALSIMVHCCKK